MQRSLTLEYWRDENAFVGRLLEVPGVFSQGKTLDDLEDDPRFQAMLEKHEQTAG